MSGEVEQIKNDIIAKKQECSNKGRGWTLQNAQFTCRRECVGDVRLETQQQVEDFGAQRCTSVLGSLVVAGSVTSLLPLRDLQNIAGDFFVQETLQLKSLHGLESLRAVKGDLIIFNNVSLVTVAQLRCLRSVTGTLQIDSNSALERIGAFNALESANDIIIVRNNQLELISGFNSRHFTNLGTFIAIENANLRSIFGFGNVKNIETSITVVDHVQLEVFCAFQRLEQANTLAFFFNLPKLRLIGSFVHLRNLNRFLMQGCDSLPTLPALGRVSELDTLFLSELPSLRDVDALSSVVQVRIQLFLSASSALTNIDGFINLQAVNEFLLITNNALVQIDGAAQIRESANVIVVQNGVLSDFCGLQTLAAVDPVGPPPFFVSQNLENPTKLEISQLPPCDPCRFVNRVLERWVAQSRITELTARFLARKLTRCTIAFAKRYGAIDLNQAQILRGALEFANTDELVCLPPSDICCDNDRVYQQYLVATQCSKKTKSEKHKKN